MALPLTIELIKSTRGKNKATLEGFAYTLTKSTVYVQQWVCEKRGVCKSRLHTKNNDVIMPKSLEEILSSHTHGSDLAFVPEQDVPDCFISLMTEFPEDAITVAQYFEETYIGKRLHDQSRRIPQFPIRIWSMYQRVKEHPARTTNNVA